MSAPRAASRQPPGRPPGKKPRTPQRPAAPNAPRQSQRTSLPESWFSENLRVLVFTLGKQYRQPLAALFTAAAIGITLALPAGLYLLVNNFSALSYQWEGTVQASLFLHHSIEEEAGRKLAKELAHREDIAAVQYISRDEAMQEFRLYSGFGEALDILEANPLPAVIVVQPATGMTAGRIEQLIKTLGERAEIQHAKLDSAWLQRLHAILDMLRRGAMLIAALLGIAVIIIVGNTIRLDIQARREEIEVLKLLGATDAFIRRPFLYTGVVFGVAGGVFAGILVAAGIWFLSGPVQDLAGLYGSDFSLRGLRPTGFAILLGSGIALGWLGSWWTVSRHLHRIEPR